MKNKFVGGFTLVELMITVAIIAIIVAIAYPSYQEQVRETRRSNAQADLLELSSYMERYYTERFTYAGATTATLPFDESPKQGNPKFYDLDLQNVGANAYTLRAIPKGGQAGDRCGTMTLNEVGQRTPANDCW